MEGVLFPRGRRGWPGAQVMALLRVLWRTSHGALKICLQGIPQVFLSCKGVLLPALSLQP